MGIWNVPLSPGGRWFIALATWLAFFLASGPASTRGAGTSGVHEETLPRGKVSSGMAVHSFRPGDSEVPVYGYKIVREYPHDAGAFTQGLIYADGHLFESTGRHGQSTLRKVELETGKVVQTHTLQGIYFGEGLTQWQNKLIQLTWRSGVGFVYDKESFAQERVFRFDTEGWGLTTDGRWLIMSDGSDVLRFLDPESFHETGRIEVRDHGEPVIRLNELEFIKGEVFANIWEKDLIARISPQTGEVLGWVDLAGLRNALGPVRQVDVLNGIAYDAERDRIFVTGKLWPKLFEIKIIPKE